MKMFKKIALAIVLVFAAVVLTACAGSKAVQGSWYVQDSSGKDSTIVFKAKQVTIDGETYNYTQNAVGNENGVSYYGITLKGESYAIIFPEKDRKIAVMIKPYSDSDYLSGTMIYAMNRTTHPSYQEYQSKYQH